MFKKILVCLDGSKLAEEILPHVTDSCSAPQSEVILLSVTNFEITIPPPETIHAYTSGTNYGTGRTPTSDMGEDRTLEPQALIQMKGLEEEQGEIRRYLDDVAKPFRASGLKVKTIILNGEVVKTILDYSLQNNISLIALTTHGSGGLRKEVFGKVAETILKQSSIPVLIIKPAGKSV